MVFDITELVANLLDIVVEIFQTIYAQQILNPIQTILNLFFPF